MPILDDTRADWNARPPLRPRTPVAWANRIGVSWHWIGPGKGPSASGPHSACLAQVRDWQWQHQHKAPPDGPWKDIGYNALICQHARAIEGRGLEFSGSHSPGVNVEHVGVQFMVGEDSGPPSAAMYARARKLRADIGDLGKNIRRDWGHQDDPVASTSCPGGVIEKWVHSGGPTAKPATSKPTAPHARKVPIMHTLVKLPDKDAVWLSDLVHRRWVQTPAELVKVQNLLKARGVDTTVREVSSLTTYGVAVGKVPNT